MIAQIVVELNLFTVMFRTSACERMLYEAAYRRCMEDCTTGSSTVNLHCLRMIQTTGYGTQTGLVQAVRCFESNHSA